MTQREKTKLNRRDFVTTSTVAVMVGNVVPEAASNRSNNIRIY